ncbi:hypothetical protein [Ralstonia solanacearum]
MSLLGYLPFGREEADLLFNVVAKEPVRIFVGEAVKKIVTRAPS